MDFENANDIIYLILFLLIEYFIGNTKKIDANSTIQLIINIVIFVYKKIKNKDGKNESL
jgi:hypothetical protein